MHSDAKIEQPLILFPTRPVSNEQICPCFPVNKTTAAAAPLKVKSCSLINCPGCLWWYFQGRDLPPYGINIHTPVYLPLSPCFSPAVVIAEAENLGRILVNYTIVPVWVSPIRSPGAVSGCQQGDGIDLTEPSSGGKSTKSLSGFKEVFIKMLNPVDKRYKEEEEEETATDSSDFDWGVHLMNFFSFEKEPELECFVLIVWKLVSEVAMTIR